jgi:hypothetical protein
MPGEGRRRDARTVSVPGAPEKEPVMPASVWIINLVVLTAVLEADLGRRKITWFRLARPVVLAGIIISFYLKGVTGTGGALAMELGLAALGTLLGVAAGAVFRVYRRPDGAAASRAGAGYAALWVLVIGARIGFAYATNHSHSLQVWLGTHHITPAALTDSLIFMAAGMLLARTVILLARSNALPAGAAGAGRREAAARVTSGADR